MRVTWCHLCTNELCIRTAPCSCSHRAPLSPHQRASEPPFPRPLAAGARSARRTIKVHAKAIAEGRTVMDIEASIRWGNRLTPLIRLAHHSGLARALGRVGFRPHAIALWATDRSHVAPPPPPPADDARAAAHAVAAS